MLRKYEARLSKQDNDLIEHHSTIKSLEAKVHSLTNDKETLRRTQISIKAPSTSCIGFYYQGTRSSSSAKVRPVKGPTGWLRGSLSAILGHGRFEPLLASRMLL